MSYNVEIDGKMETLTQEQYERYIGICAIKRLKEKFPWSTKYDLYYSYDIDDEESVMLAITNESTDKHVLLVENMETNEYRVESKPGIGTNFIPITDELIETIKNYLG